MIERGSRKSGKSRCRRKKVHAGHTVYVTTIFWFTNRPFCNVIECFWEPKYDILDIFDIYKDLIRVKVPLYCLSAILQFSVYILTAPAIDVDGSFHSPFPLNPASSKSSKTAKNWFKRFQEPSPQLFLWPAVNRRVDTYGECKRHNSQAMV